MGQPLGLGGPYHWLDQFVPGLDALRSPGRFSVFVIVAMAAAAGAALAARAAASAADADLIV